MKTPRIQVSLPLDIANSLSSWAKACGKSKSNIAAELIAKAIELEEDRYFSELGEKRLEENQEWLSHEDVWK